MVYEKKRSTSTISKEYEILVNNSGFQNHGIFDTSG